jgi:hypothetical protein
MLGNFIIIGEQHLIQEKDSIIMDIITDIAKNTDKDIQLFIEYPPSLQIYIDKLFNNGDSIALKKHIQYAQNWDTTTMSLKNELNYKYILKLYNIHNELRNIEIICIGEELQLRRAVYSILDILNNYHIENKDILERTDYLTSLLNKELLTIDDYHEYQRFICSHFYSNTNIYNEIIKDSMDYTYFSLIINHSKLFDIYSDEKEYFLYHNILKHIDVNKTNIAHMGNGHVSKYYKKKTKASGNRLTVAHLINNSRKSPFRKKVYSISITALSIQSKSILKSKSIFNYPYPRMFTNDEMDKIASNLTTDVTLINTSDMDFKYASDAFDLVYFIKTSNSNLYRNNSQ